MRVRSFAVVSFAVFAMVGCGYQTPDVHVPAAVNDGSATGTKNITVMSRRTIDPSLESEVRSEMDGLLGRVGGTVHACVNLEEKNEFASTTQGSGVFGIALYAFGAPYESETVSVDVEIEKDGRLVRGHGAATMDGSLYTKARRRAMAAALDHALADLH